MADIEDVLDKGDQYAKRMLERKRSSECYYKSLQRRMSIMRAIDKNYITSPSNFRFHGDAFKELRRRSESGLTLKDSNGDSLELTQHEVSRTSSGKEFSSQNYHLDMLPSDHELYLTRDSLGCDKSSTDANFNIVHYQSPRRKSGNSLTGHNLYDSPCEIQQEIGIGTRMSIGEYFGGASHRELNVPYSTIGKIYEDELEQVNDESRHRDSDLFFVPRVLEILEPEVVKCERLSTEPRVSNRRRASDMKFIQETFKGIQLENTNESISTSLVSEDMKELDREMEKLQFHPNIAEKQSSNQSQQKIQETPKRIYPNLSLIKRMSNNFSPNNLCYINDTKKTDKSPITDFNSNMTDTYYEFEKPTSPDKENFGTPMPIPDSQMKNLQCNRKNKNEQNSSPNLSFLKRNASLILNNLHVPKIRRRKPNLESTRNITNNGGNTISPQIECSISTLTLPNTTTSPDGYDLIKKPYQEEMDRHKRQQMHTHMQNNKNATIPYEVENFLELALGDERYNTTLTYANSDARDRTNSYFNASELISAEVNPSIDDSKRETRGSSNQPKHSSTLNRTRSIYKTLTQRLKKKFRGSIKDESTKPTNEDIIPTDVNPKLRDDVKKLLDEVELQQTLIYQTSKALELCNSMREFMASSERVESERLLILASLRKKAAIEEIRRMISYNLEQDNCRERAEITVKEIKLQLREDVLRRERQNGDIVEWFVVVVTEGLTVWATHAVDCPKCSPSLVFPDQLSIPGLKPDFRLSLKVYSLKLQQIVYNHEDKYHISQSGVSGKGSSCPMTKKLLRRTWGSQKKRSAMSPKQFEIRMSGVKESSFVMCGSVDFALHDLSLSSPWVLTSVPSNSVLHGTIDVKLSCKLQLSVLHSGFLTHGDEAGGFASWNRRWCVLDGYKILFWNYPREQGCHPPLYTIDLVNCISPQIGLIDRSLCAKARTLLVETARKRNAVDKDSIIVECHSTFTVVRNLLSCDTNQDLTDWQSKLNHVVSTLREWNIIDTQSSPEVSDL